MGPPPAPRHLFTPAGQQALAAALRRRPLLAFDLDGTLAPLVDHPEDAAVPADAARSLGRLAERLPVAIVSGRAVADVVGRLGFSPRFVVGNHGAEDGTDREALARLTPLLDPWRARLHAEQGLLAAAGVVVEDKGASIALHFRRAPRPAAARAFLAHLATPPDPAVRLFGGKDVVNLAPAAAPDKAQAVAALVARAGAALAVFAGDDLNDEPVFAAAPPDWLTVRVGGEDPPRGARFFLHGPQEVPAWLERMLALLG